MIALTDDHTLKHSFIPSTPNDENDTINQLKACLLRIHVWMDSNRLTMNTLKTEFIYFHSRQHLAKCIK